MPAYGARLYNGAGELLPRLPLLGVQAGTVVNGVGDCTLTFARARTSRVWWKDARWADVWRLDPPVARIGMYWLETWTEKADDDLTPATDENRSLDDLKQSWIAKANTPCIFLSAKRRTNIDKFRQDLYGMVREIHAGRYPFNNFLY